MWPLRDDALGQTIEAEQAVEDLYAEALRRWAPEVESAVLPSLTASAASALPPNPEGVEDAAGAWSQISEELILRGMAGLWSYTAIEALTGIGLPVPDLPDDEPEVDKKVLRTLARSTHSSSSRIRQAMARVDNDSVLRRAREAFIEEARAQTAKTPGTVKLKLEMTMRQAAADTSRDALRASIGEVLAPSGEVMRGIARSAGYQAAGVQNSAILGAAQARATEPLEKTWICTIDSRTRPSHWAADGQRVPIDGTFTVGHDSLRYPGDSRGSSKETDNCRCRMGILAPYEDLPDEVDRHTERGPGDSTVRNRTGSQQDEIKRREERGEIRAREDPDGIGRVTASGGWVSPSETTYEIEENTMGDDAATLAVEEETTPSGESYRTFSDAVIAVIGEPTSDGRMFASDIELSFRDFPLPLMWTRQSTAGHMDAYTVGVLESATVDGNKVVASGYLLNTDEADEAAEQISHGITGPSVDLAATEWVLTDENGKEITEEEWWDMPSDAVVYQTITKAELIGTTLVATPAFGATSISLNSERESRDVALVASAADDFRPRVYDHRLFSNPNLTGPTLPTMGDDGRIYGHLACFGQCHRSIQSECIVAPRSASNYSHFHTSPAVRLDNGERLPVGRLTVNTGHAPDTYSGAQAAAHYDNTGTCFALVRVGEDEHGVWFSGVAAPWATAEQIEMGLSAPLSGDWRDFGQGLELVAALAVNTPGFAARGRDDDQGRPIALVASLGPAPDTDRGGMSLTVDQVRDVVRATVLEMDERTRLAEREEAALERARALTASADSARLESLLNRAQEVLS